MLLSDMKPFVRFVQYIEFNTESKINSNIPYDARLFYTLHGCGEIEIDGKVFEMPSGSLLLINPGVEYRIMTPTKSVTYFVVNFDYIFDFRHFCFPIAPVMKNEFKKDQQLGEVFFDDFKDLNKPLYLRYMRNIEQRCRDLEYEYTHKLNHFELLCSSILKEILLTVIRNVEAVESQYSEKVAEILDFVHQNYREPITNSYLAEKFGFHPNYLSEMIKRHTGIPLHRYLLQLRIMHAISFLESGEQSIGSVAESCGFPNIYHFSKTFKNIVGVSPKNYLR